MDPERKAWRDQVVEPALDSHIPIIDAHHHVFAEARRPRLEPYLPEALFADMLGSGHNIIGTVHVSAFSNYRPDGPEHLRVVGETEYIDGIAEEAERRGNGVGGACAAIVGSAELMLGEAVGEVLDAHIAASRRLRGVRRMTISDPDLPSPVPSMGKPGILAEPAFRAGLLEVAKRNLSFDASVAQSQIAELVDLARAIPQATLVLNHIGSPLAIGRYADRRKEAFIEWRTGMAELATCPNVFVKIGGLNMEFTGLGTGAHAERPLNSQQLAERQHDHVLTTIDLFGPDRCLFESNFPVDQWYVSYIVLWNTFKRLTSGFSVNERESMFSGTARRVYRMDIPAPDAVA